VTSVVMCDCSTKLASQLTRAQSDQYCVILVGLNTGSVFWLPFIKDTPVVPETRKLYHAGRRVQDIVCPKGKSKLILEYS